MSNRYQPLGLSSLVGGLAQASNAMGNSVAQTLLTAKQLKLEDERLKEDRRLQRERDDRERSAALQKQANDDDIKRRERMLDAAKSDLKWVRDPSLPEGGSWVKQVDPTKKKREAPIGDKVSWDPQARHESLRGDYLRLREDELNRLMMAMQGGGPGAEAAAAERDRIFSGAEQYAQKGTVDYFDRVVGGLADDHITRGLYDQYRRGYGVAPAAPSPRAPAAPPPGAESTAGTFGLQPFSSAAAARISSSSSPRTTAQLPPEIAAKAAAAGIEVSDLTPEEIEALSVLAARAPTSVPTTAAPAPAAPAPAAPAPAAPAPSGFSGRFGRSLGPVGGLDDFQGIPQRPPAPPPAAAPARAATAQPTAQPTAPAPSATVKPNTPTLPTPMDVLEAVMPAAAFSRMPRPGMNIPPPVFPVAPPTTRTTSGGALAADAVTRALGPSPVPPSTGQVSVSDAMSRVLGDNTARALASDRDAAVGAQLAAGGKVRDDLIPRDLRPVVLGEVDGERPVINLSGGAAESMQSVIDNLSPEAANLLTSILIKTGSATRGAGPIEQTLVNDDPLMLLKKSQQELVDEAAANKNPVGKIPKGAPARHGHFTGDSIDADFMSLLDKRVDPGSPRIVDAMLAEEIRSALTAAGWRQDVRGDRPHWTYAPGRNQ